MADIRISQLPVAPTAITGTELVPIVQNGLTVQTTVSAITQSPSLTQTFLTVGQQPLLPNSRYFSTGVGIGITDGGAQGAYTIALNGTSGSLEAASTGFAVKTAPNTINARSLTTSGNGISVANGNGIAGNPTFQLTGLALAIANMSGTGLIGLNSSVLSPLTITGTANQITMLNGNGAGGNPTISIADNAVLPGTAGVVLPSGTTAQRGTTTAQVRYNYDTNRYEGRYASSWQNFGLGDGTVTSVSGTTNQINVVNAGGISTVSISDNPIVPGVGGIQIPAGTTAQRNTGSGTGGVIRLNKDTGLYEGYSGGVWSSFAAGTGVTSVATGTGLTGGPITSTGTISIANTGVVAGAYGSSSLVPVLNVNAQGQITSISQQATNAPAYQGVWNANTNTPTLTSSTGTAGYYYVVSVAGNTTLNGVTGWNVGDWVIFSNGVWQKIPGSSTESFTNLITTNLAVTGLTGYMYANGAGYATASTTIPTTALSGILGVANGGTGLSSLTAGYIPYGNGAGALLSSAGLNYNAATNTLTTPVLGVNSTTSTTPNLSFNASNSGITSGAAVAGSYLQTIIQNKSGTAGASTNYVLSNDLGTDSSYYGEFGMNSSVYSASTPADFFSINNQIYFSGHDGDLGIGSGNGYKTYLTWGTVGQSAHVINAAGAIGLSTNLGTTPALSGTTGFGTAGQFLQSSGNAASPTWATAVTSVTGTAPVVSSGGATPAISMAAANTTTNGYLTSTDWNTFNGKQPAGAYLTAVTADAPLAGSGTAASHLSITAATSSVNGYLTSADWTTFNSKQPAGTYVTAVSVASSNGFTGTSSGGATPAITLATSISGILKGNGTAISAATAGTDYVVSSTATNFTAQQYFGNATLTDAATIAWAANTQQVATFTFVSTNRTMGAPTGLVNGGFYALAVIQNAGSNTLTWNSVFKWAGGAAPTLSAVAGAKDYFTFRSDGTNLYQQGISQAVA